MSAPAVAFSAAGSAPAGHTGAPPSLVHAYLQFYTPGNTVAAEGGPLGKVEFQFNPKELTLAKSATWRREAGEGNAKSSPPQYKGPQPSKLALEMFFDASDTQDSSVVQRVEMLFAACTPTKESLGKDQSSPPWVRFKWGGIT